MPALPVGIQLASLRMPFRKALYTASKLGAQGVEIDARNMTKPVDLSQTAKRQLRKELDDLNLRVCAVAFLTRRGYNVLEDLDRRVVATKNAMKMAYDLGASLVINQVGRIPASPEDAEWQLLVEVLTDLGNYGQRIGALLAADTGSESGPELARLLDALPEGFVGVNLDPGNLIINGFSPAEAVSALGPRILHIHAKDGVRDLAQGRGLEVPLGRGTADFPALLGAMEDHQYRGYLTIEREHSDDPVTEIGQAVQFLQNI